MAHDRTYTAFDNDQLIASGDLASMLTATHAHLALAPDASLLIFDDSTGRQVDYDFRGSPDDVLARYAPAEPARGPGRPKLGVVAREVTLLPRHWEWLAEQPSGASAALRRLVDQARNAEDAGVRAAAVTGRVMTSLAGNLPGFEEAYRALDAGNRARFEEHTASWPTDVRAHLMRLAAPAFAP